MKARVPASVCLSLLEDRWTFWKNGRLPMMVFFRVNSLPDSHAISTSAIDSRNRWRGPDQTVGEMEAQALSQSTATSSANARGGESSRARLGLDWAGRITVQST